MAGRGSFTESFPLFGYGLGDYDALFREKLELLLAIMHKHPLSWSGKFRAPLYEQEIYPRAKNNGKIPVRIAVGGTPESVVRAAQMGLPIIFAIIGGEWADFKPFFDLYTSTYLQA